MIELEHWIAAQSLTDRPWLMLGKGPTFSLRGRFDLGTFHTMSLNHVVRELPVTAAHMIDIDVAEACADHLLTNSQWVFMPRYPHIDCKPDRGRPLESFFDQIPALGELSRQGRLVWYCLYNSRKSPLAGDSSPIGARFFSSEAALGILARAGVKDVRTLGIDGGQSYSAQFDDLNGTTRLANGQPSFDLQFEELDRIVRENGMTLDPLVEPMRVFVGADATQVVPGQVLEYSIKKYASRPVEVHHMVDAPVPMPREARNRPRTGFSFARFLIPKLCGFQGRGLYVDSDMQVFTDLAELFDVDFGAQKVLCTNQPEPPEAWRDGRAGFHGGRQMSVMLLDCSRLPWDIEKIVAGLDSGEFTYERLMFDLCLVDPEEIADRIHPDWNCLERYEAGRCRLLHYTVVTTQPWRNDKNPLCEIWMECYREAVAAGAVSRDEVEKGVRAGYLKPSLLEAFVDQSYVLPRPDGVSRWRMLLQRAARPVAALRSKLVRR